MALTKADPVAAARKGLEDAEAAVVVEGRRLANAVEVADKFTGDAAGVDPDADAKGFERATSKLAEYRATIEIVSTREAGAKARAGAAREALASAEAEAKRARLAVLDAEIAAREAKAIERVVVAVRAFDAELRELAALGKEGAALSNALEPGTASAFRYSRTLLPHAGSPLGALQLLAERGQA
jgi:hypothetical protein